MHSLCQTCDRPRARDSGIETGLYYYRARYYDSGTGRFLGEDESGFAESSNFYPYVANDPTNLVDSTGFRATKPTNLPIGTPKKYWKPLTKGMNNALKRLNKKPCADMFRTPCDPNAGRNQLNNTPYRFLALPQGPKVAAQTAENGDVQINMLGLYMTATDGRIALPDGSSFDLGGVNDVRALILLHELGHELSGGTGFVPDTDPAINAAHTKRVIDACFIKH
jgi:RHS repeat-associated protein